MAYDELNDHDGIRPIYKKPLQALAEKTAFEKKRAMRLAHASIDRDASYLPLVRLLTDREYNKIAAGVRQRGRALQLFLTDHYFGGRSYEQSGFLKHSHVKKIAKRYDAEVQNFSLRPETIQFWYGPDVTRDESGQFRVVEDNIGFVGGLGDLESMHAAIKAFGGTLPAARDPSRFYKAMAKDYKRQAQIAGGGRTILISYPRSQRLNHEDQRLETLLKGEGITSVTDLRTLKVRNEGLYLRDERVGFVILNIKFEDIDAAASAPYRVLNFWQAVAKGKVGVSYAPGLEFVGDKAFCATVEKLVEFYLCEPCLLPTLPTVRLNHRRSFDKVRTAPEKWVVKLARGQSGESVWIGRHLVERAWDRLMKRVEETPDAFIAQIYSEPSLLLGHAVDLRPLALISPGAELISPIPWGRASATKKGKTNISCGGLLSAVAVIAEPKRR